MRCFKDIATAGTGLVDAEAVQPEYHAFWHSKNSFEQKAALTFTVFLQTFVDRCWKHFIFVIWKSWRKLEENLEKIWGKYVEIFSFAILFLAVV